MAAPEDYCPGCNETRCRCAQDEAIEAAEYEALMEGFHGLEDLQPVKEPMTLEEYEEQHELYA